MPNRLERSRKDARISRVDEKKLIFVIVGPRHAGKTVYLASLANNASITSGDPATIKLLKLHWGALRAGKNPPATAGAYTELEFIYRGEGESGRFDAEFSVADYDGHFAEIMSDYDSGIKGLDELRAAFEIADGFIVFMPFDNDDIKTMEAARFEIGHFIRIVRLCRGGPEKIDTPLVVVINKWDKSPDFKSRAEDEAALKFANSTESYRSLLLTLENFFANVFVIPVSAYGHAAPGDVPVKGKIVPYRAEEPIQKLLAVNYRLFRQKLQKAEDENDWGQCLSVLKNAAKLWRGANGRKELEKRLALVSANYAKDLKSRLVKARNMEEWEGIFKSADGALLIDFLSPEEKREIANTRETPLRAAYASLEGKLRSARDLDEFKAIREESPESAWSRFFDMDQKRSIDDLEKNFARSRLKKRVFFWGKWGCVAFCALLLTVAVFWRSGVESRYLDALGDHGSLAERYHKLREFMAYGVNSPLTAKIFADKFADAEKKAANLVSRINESWEKEFAGIIAEEDPLVRLESATRFRAKLSEDDVPGQKSMDVKIAALIQNSGRQVDLIQKIEAAANAEELDKIGTTFATLPEKEKNLLEKRLASRAESLREKARVARIEADLAKKAEMARKAEEEARRLSAGDDYRGALAFVNKDGNDPAAVGRVKSALNSIYFRNLDSVAREDAGMEDLAYLLGHKNALNVSGESALAQLKGALKKKLGAEGAELADELDTPVGSLIQLEDIEGKLTQYDEVVAGLAEAPFRLSVSPEISRKLEKGRQRLREYRRALDTGARAGSFEIVASQPNSLNLRGRSWTSAFRKNDNVSVYFPNGQSASSDNESFSAEERGSEFVLNLGPFVLEKMYGEATLKTSGDGETRSCSWSLSVGANELFAMLNNGFARIPAGGSCKGLVLEFKK